MRIEQARKDQSGPIARMIMEAMNLECCQNLAGPNHTLDDFHRLLTRLVQSENTQYSYQNTLTALTDDGDVMGICVSYDGARLHELRQPFIDGARRELGMDHSNISDETQAGELYLDSLCVNAAYRGHGVATALLNATVDKARRMGLPKVGLLVDDQNPGAERLYHRVGFVYAGNNQWGGHSMKHLTKDV